MSLVVRAVRWLDPTDLPSAMGTGLLRCPERARAPSGDRAHASPVALPSGRSHQTTRDQSIMASTDG